MNNIQTSVFIATSLDGFIARKDGSIDWLTNANTVTTDDYGYNKFIASIDAIIMGKNTFNQVLTFESWPYHDKKIIVLSHNPLSIPTHLTKTISSSTDSPPVLLDTLAANGIHHVYIDGGYTIQSFLVHGLVNTITITSIPIILGEGIPLFGAVPHNILLKHLTTTAYDCGFVQSTYEVIA